MKGDAKKYNRLALKVLNSYPEILINDLYGFSIPVLESHAIKPMNVHYDAEGSRLQGIHVAKEIASALKIDTILCPSTEIIQKEFKEYESSK